MEQGNILSNFRTRTIGNQIVESDITGEIKTVEEFLEFPGVYGFRLNEVPRTDLQGITSVIRNIDSQIFTWVASDTPPVNQYGFDYNNPLPIVYFPSSEVGKTFTIAYKGTGGAYTPSNIIDISALSGDIHERLINSIRTNILDYSLVNQNVFTYNNVITVNNLSITGNCTFRTNASTSIGIIEVLGDLTLANFAILKTIRVILIVHGSINCPIGTARIIGQDGFTGGSGLTATNLNVGGAGGAGTGQNGFQGAQMVILSGWYGGLGGYSLVDQYTQSNSAAIGSYGGGGGGGGWDGGGLGGSAIAAYAGQLGGGGGVGAGKGVSTPGSVSGGAASAGTLMHGGGGRGGDGQIANSNAVSGCGGGSGGSSIIIICLGDISPNVTLYAGRNGLPGGGNTTNFTHAQSGSIVLYSRYANVDIPATLDVNGIGGGYAGTIYREQIGKSSKMTGFIINNLLSELASYGFTNYGLWNKLAGDI